MKAPANATQIPSPSLVESRLREASRLSDLRADKRLDAKIDMSPVGIGRRLTEVAELLEACKTMAALRHASK